jgi:Homeodomain-like domain
VNTFLTLFYFLIFVMVTHSSISALSESHKIREPTLHPPRTRPCVWFDDRLLRVFYRMDWRRKVIVAKLREGLTYGEAAAVVGIHRQSFWRWINGSEKFAQAVAEARLVGLAERTYRLWLRHPLRGKRPTTGKGHGGTPRFSY